MAAGGRHNKAGRTAMAKADALCRTRGRLVVPVDTTDFSWPMQLLVTGPTGGTIGFAARRRGPGSSTSADHRVKLAAAGLHGQDGWPQQGLIATA
jgi:hypothetical protein